MVFYRVDQSKMPLNVNVKQKLTGFLDFVSSPVCHVSVSRTSKCHVIVIDPDYVTDHVTNYTWGPKLGSCDKYQKMTD